MKEITSKEKAVVRKYAQKLKSTFQVGALGIHDLNIEAIREGFNKKEVLKVKVHKENKEDKTIVKEIATSLEKQIPCIVCGVIGNTIILYKENLELEEKSRFYVKRVHKSD